MVRPEDRVGLRLDVDTNFGDFNYVGDVVRLVRQRRVF